MEPADLARIVAHFDRELIANIGRHRAVQCEVSRASRRPRRAIADRPALVAVLGLAAGAATCGGMVWVLKTLGL
jgi:hypothetical protein